MTGMGARRFAPVGAISLDASVPADRFYHRLDWVLHHEGGGVA